MSPYEKIIEALEVAEVAYELSEHQPVTTSAEAESVTGFPSTMGAKSIVFKVDNDFILAVLRGSEKADFKKLRKHFDARKARMATPEEVYEVMRVRIGACYPFGGLAEIDMVVDEGLASNQEISFSPGVHDKHIKMRWDDYKKVAQPKLIDIVR